MEEEGSVVATSSSSAVVEKSLLLLVAEAWIAAVPCVVKRRWLVTILEEKAEVVRKVDDAACIAKVIAAAIVNFIIGLIRVRIRVVD